MTGVRWPGGRIIICVDKLGSSWERDQVQRTAKHYDDDDGHGKEVELRLWLLAAVRYYGGEALPPPPPPTKRTGVEWQRGEARIDNTRSSLRRVCKAGWVRNSMVLSTCCYFPAVPGQSLCRVYGTGCIGYFCFFSVQPVTQPCKFFGAPLGSTVDFSASTCLHFSTHYGYRRSRRRA